MGWDWDDDRTLLWGRVQGQLVIQRGDHWARRLRDALGVAQAGSVDEGVSRPTGEDSGPRRRGQRDDAHEATGGRVLRA